MECVTSGRAGLGMTGWQVRRVINQLQKNWQTRPTRKAWVILTSNAGQASRLSCPSCEIKPLNFESEHRWLGVVGARDLYCLEAAGLACSFSHHDNTYSSEIGKHDRNGATEISRPSQEKHTGGVCSWTEEDRTRTQQQKGGSKE